MISRVCLFINKFNHPDPERQNELDYCLKKNEDNEHIHEIYTITGGRAKFNDFFNAICPKCPDTINIIANSDIYFDDTIEKVQSIKPRELWALTRWEVKDNTPVFFEKFHNGALAKHSQDVWIFRGRPNVNCSFYIGQPGCDNRITMAFKESGFKVSNPSLSIKAVHVHKSMERDYEIKDRVRGKYLFVEPVRL